MMTQQEFEKLAIVIRDQVDSIQRLGLDHHETGIAMTVLESTANDIADVCSGSNDSFDYEMFFKACGI